MDSRNNPASEFISFSADEMIPEDSDDNTDDNRSEASENNEDEDDAIDLKPPTTATSNALKRASTVALADRCPKCKNRKTNVECVSHVCKQCCIKIPGYCKVPSHKTAKPYAKQGYVSCVTHNDTETTTATTSIAPEMDPPKEETVAKLDSAMQQKPRPTSLFISYSQGTHGGSPRKITPLRWLTGRGGKFDALCHLSQSPQKKMFYACRVTRVADSDWDLALPLPISLYKVQYKMNNYFFICVLY